MTMTGSAVRYWVPSGQYALFAYQGGILGGAVETSGAVNASGGSGVNTGTRQFTAKAGQEIFISGELENTEQTYTYCRVQFDKTA
jgi:hypothetical protein